MDKSLETNNNNTLDTSYKLEGFDRISKVFPEAQISFSNSPKGFTDHVVVTIPAQDLIPVLTFLRDDSFYQCETLIDICASDFPQFENRFMVNYHLLSLDLVRRINVQVWTDEETPLDSVTSIFKSAGWYEREVFDLFGVFFNGNPDLRRILSDYGFQGHPMRRDFPLTGYYEIRYDESQKRIVSENVELAQSFRSFDFSSPWDQSVEHNIIEKKPGV
jgi:NADH-quinone oxidoreductase subunit C